MTLVVRCFVREAFDQRFAQLQSVLNSHRWKSMLLLLLVTGLVLSVAVHQRSFAHRRFVLQILSFELLTC